MDITHDPAHGLDGGDLAERLRKMGLAGDGRLHYVIWNRRIASSTKAGWAWTPYSGSDPHTGHVHVSLTHTLKYADSSAPWNIWGGVSVTSTQTPKPHTGDEKMLIVDPPGADMSILAGDKLVHLSSPTDAQHLMAAGVPTWVVTQDQWNALTKAYGAQIS